MSIYKGTMYVNFGNAGYTESWYKTTAEDIDLTLDSFKRVADSRQRCMGKGGPRIEYVRVSDESVRGDAKVFSWDGGIAKHYSGLQECDSVHQCLLIRLNSGSLYKRMFSMRGTPDDFIEKGRWTDDNGYTQELDRHFGFLTAENWGLKVINKGNTNPERPVVAAVWAAGFWTITSPAHTMTGGEYITLRGLQGTLVPKGKVQVDVLNADTFKITNPALQGTYIGGGVFRIHKYTYVLTDSHVIVRAAKRDTGRCFFSPTGRR